MKSLVFHLRETRVEVHVSILLLLSYLLYQGWMLNLPAWHITTGCVILVVSILVHEFAHVAAFRRLLGVPSRVWIFAFGGATIPTQMAWRFRGWKGVLVSLAGPISNFVLALLCLLLIAAASDMVTFELALTALVLNLSLGAFNLLPSVPFDGGRVFMEFMLWLLGRFPRLANAIVVIVGSFCGMALVLAAFYLRDPLLVLIGLCALYANSPLSRWH